MEIIVDPGPRLWTRSLKNLDLEKPKILDTWKSWLWKIWTMKNAELIRYHMV